MKLTYIKYYLIAFISIVAIAMSCTDSSIDPIEDLNFDQELSPAGLTVKVRDRIALELNWEHRRTSSQYVAQISEGDPNFGVNNIVRTLELTVDQLPFKETLSPETTYYVRVKGVSAAGLASSNWTPVISATTLSEQIFISQEDGDIKAKGATLRWQAGAEVTHLFITPGDITRPISEQEKADGVAILFGLTPETEYSAVIFNDAQARGNTTFTTTMDLGGGTLVTPSDDLLLFINNAADGDILVLEGGDYGDIGVVELSKSLTIRALENFNKPTISMAVNINAGASIVELIDLDLGVNSGGNYFIQIREAGSYDLINISGCNIHDYPRSLIRGDTQGATLTNVIIDNTVITNMSWTGGDFFDVRKSNILNWTVTNTTFNSCATTRDFFRLDNSGDLAGTGAHYSVVVENCTFYASVLNGKELLDVDFGTNEVKFNKNIIANSDGIFQNATNANVTEWTRNNYFMSPAYTTTSLIVDSGNFTMLDPAFMDAASGNFKLGNQDLIDNGIGDPRWW